DAAAFWTLTLQFLPASAKQAPVAWPLFRRELRIHEVPGIGVVSKRQRRAAVAGDRQCRPSEPPHSRWRLRTPLRARPEVPVREESTARRARRMANPVDHYASVRRSAGLQRGVGDPASEIEPQSKDREPVVRYYAIRASGAVHA